VGTVSKPSCDVLHRHPCGAMRRGRVLHMAASWFESKRKICAEAVRELAASDGCLLRLDLSTIGRLVRKNNNLSRAVDLEPPNVEPRLLGGHDCFQHVGLPENLDTT
jgi:hypothetical protein